MPLHLCETKYPVILRSGPSRPGKQGLAVKVHPHVIEHRAIVGRTAKFKIIGNRVEVATAQIGHVNIWVGRRFHIHFEAPQSGGIEKLKLRWFQVKCCTKNNDSIVVGCALYLLCRESIHPDHMVDVGSDHARSLKVCIVHESNAGGGQVFLVSGKQTHEYRNYHSAADDY